MSPPLLLGYVAPGSCRLPGSVFVGNKDGTRDARRTSGLKLCSQDLSTRKSIRGTLKPRTSRLHIHTCRMVVHGMGLCSCRGFNDAHPQQISLNSPSPNHAKLSPYRYLRASNGASAPEGEASSLAIAVVASAVHVEEAAAAESDLGRVIEIPCARDRHTGDPPRLALLHSLLPVVVSFCVLSSTTTARRKLGIPS